LTGVEVLASGVIWKGSFDSEAIASFGVPIELAPASSQFSCEYFPESETNEAKYVYSWYNSLVNRNVDNLLSGRIELYRNGDILVATNGVERIISYQPPDGFYGIGQDDDWVRANFTNAEEIISIGYTNWVKNSVAENAMNGRYSFSVKFNDNNHSPSLLTVGRYKVYVKEPGVYTFLLDVYNEYSFALFPSDAQIEVVWDDGYTGKGQSYIIESTELMGDDDWRRSSFLMRPLIVTSPDFLQVGTADGLAVSAFWNVSGNIAITWRDPLETVQFTPSNQVVTTISNVAQPTTLTVKMSNSGRTEYGHVYIAGENDSSFEGQPKRVDEVIAVDDGLKEELVSVDGFDFKVHWFSRVSSEMVTGSEILRTNLTLQANTAYYVGAFALSSEYPVWTGRDSQYNDKLYWKADISSFSFLTNATVNSLHSKFQIADSENNVIPEFGKVVHVGGKFITTDSENLELRLSLCAVNVGDSKRESCAIIGVFPVMVRQKNYPQTTGLALTTDSGLTRTNALIRVDVPAYINSVPEAPELTSRIVSLPSWIDVDWRGTITSERTDRYTYDNRTLVLTNIAGDVAYDIKAAMTNEIVGGRCSIIAKLADEEFEVAKFSIRGKNPLDAVVKNYIDSNVDEEFRDYAWMIAKHESRNPPTGQVYNQFNPSGGNYKELPFKGNGDYNWGWGIGQIDRGENNSRTAEIYDWHENVKSMNATLRNKRSNALRFLGYYASAYSNQSNWSDPPSTNINGHVVSAEMWATMTLYNGASGIPEQRTPTHNKVFFSPLQFNPQTGEWLFHQNTRNPNYVRDVMIGSSHQEVE
jgi:hypothetical protein